MSILFEQPLNEQIRVCLRLEKLVTYIVHFIENPSIPGSKTALEMINQIVELLDRSDLRQKLAQELTRLIEQLNRLLNTPKVNKNALNKTINELKEAFSILDRSNDKFASHLRANDFLCQIKQFQNMPGGLSLINCPALSLWLNAPSPSRNKNIKEWLSEVQDVYQVSNLILALLRKSAYSSQQVAKKGFLQHPINPQIHCQLLQIELSSYERKFYPQISASRHMLNIHFYELDMSTHKKQQTTESIEFQLKCCAL